MLQCTILTLRILTFSLKERKKVKIPKSKWMINVLLLPISRQYIPCVLNITVELQCEHESRSKHKITQIYIKQHCKGIN